MMATLAKVLTHATATNVEIETLKTLLLFCGVGLLVSLVAAMTYGLDLSSGFF